MLVGERRVHEADGALADDEDRIVGREVEELDALEHGVQRLDKCSLLEGHAVGDRNNAAVVDDEIHHANVLGEAAAGRLEAGRGAGLLIERALRRSVLAAVVALAAGNMMEAHDAVADSEFGDACADLGDHSGHFMTEDARRGVRAAVDFFEIGAADAAGGDLDEQLTGADARNGDRFEAHVVDAAVNDCAHGGGDLCIDLKFRTQDLGSHAIRRCDLVRQETRAVTPRCFGKPSYYSRPSG